jgi:hypothetical protein
MQNVCFKIFCFEIAPLLPHIENANVWGVLNFYFYLFIYFILLIN